MPGLFVTATGTEVGKTFVTCGLLAAGRRAGVAMDGLKPLLTGYDPDTRAESDAGLVLAALGRAVNDAAVARVSPFRFAAPLSPNMAAAREAKTVAFDAVVDLCRARVTPDRLVLIEGIGGVMVPLDTRHTVLDLIAALDLPVILVSGTALGALSYALTALEVLRQRHRAPDLIVLNESPGTNVPVAETRATLLTFCPGSHIEILPRDAAPAEFDRLFADHLARFGPVPSA